MTTETPAQAPYPVEDFLSPSVEELSTSALAMSDQASSLPCCIPVHVGLFFDGANNNMRRDRRRSNHVSFFLDRSMNL